MTTQQLKQEIENSNLKTQAKAEALRYIGILENTYSGKNGHAVIVEMPQDEYQEYIKNRKR